MRLNKKAKEYLCLGNPEDIPKKGWSIEFLDVAVRDVDIDRVYCRNVITDTAFFDIKIIDGTISLKNGIELTAKKSATAKSALIEFGDGALLLATVGSSGCELNVSSPVLSLQSVVHIHHFTIELTA